MPVPPLTGVDERDDDEMPEADGDLLVAARAEVDLCRRVRLNPSELGVLIGERIGDEFHGRRSTGAGRRRRRSGPTPTVRPQRGVRPRLGGEGELALEDREIGGAGEAHAPTRRRDDLDVIGAGRDEMPDHVGEEEL